MTANVRQRHQWERAAVSQLRDGGVDRAIEAYRQRGRVHVGQSRADTMARAVADWYRQVTVSGDLTSGLLIGTTTYELNQRARSHLAAARRLHGPALETRERTFQAGDRILCRKNQSRLGVLNGDLATTDSIDQEAKSLTIRLDRDPETSKLPACYFEQGAVDYGYALTGHKAQGVTTDRTFVVVDGN
ncbi:MAG: AAA family ATPase [Actinomycetota bacterium]|nr:AAA family ATPase [Actinomycetota bacterium]